MDRRIALWALIGIGIGITGSGFASAQTFEEVAPMPFSSYPDGITAAPDGALWFVETARPAIGRVTSSGQLTLYLIGLNAPATFVGSIAMGPDGGLWFTEIGKISRIGLDGQITHLSIGRSGIPTSLVTGPDGAIWFTDSVNGIGRMVPGENATFFSLPNMPGASPGGIIVGPDGNLWFSRQNPPQIIRITPGGLMVPCPMPDPRIFPAQLAVGADGNIWFAEGGRARVGRMTLDGVVTEFATTHLLTGSLVRAVDGSVWVGEQQGFLASVDRNGVVREFSTDLKGGTYPGLVGGPDGRLWYTHSNRADSAGVGRLSLPPAPLSAVYLNNARFEVGVSWTTPDASGSGTAIPLTGDAGAFWFFTPNNLELIVKVLDGGRSTASSGSWEES